MRINEALHGCDDRVVVIYSTSEETNHIEDDVFKVHDMIVSKELDNGDGDDDDDDEYNEKQMVTVRMLVPYDLISCLIGSGGQVIQKLRNETNAQIRVINDNLPIYALALSHDELLQIIVDLSAVREALYQVASLLYDNQSQFQNYFLSSSSSLPYPGGLLMSHALTSSHKNYSAPRDIDNPIMPKLLHVCHGVMTNP